MDERALARFGYVAGKHRRCRDVLCLGAFVAAWAAYIVVGSIGLHVGNPKAFLYGLDYQGNMCGTKSMRDFPYVAYPRTNQDFLWNLNVKNPLEYRFFGICTDQCPGLPGSIDYICDYAVHDPRARAPFPHPDAIVLDCLSRTDEVARCRFIREHCWYVPVVTKPVLFRCIPRYEGNYSLTDRCIFPTDITNPTDPQCLMIRSESVFSLDMPAQPVLLFDQLNQLYYSWGRYVTDLVRGWWVVLVAGALMPAALSFLWLLLMKSFTRAVVLLSLAALLTAGVLLCVFLYAQAGVVTYDWIAKYNLEKYAFLSNAQTLYFAYAFTAFLSLVLLVCWVMRRSIARSLDVMQLGAKALRKLPMALVFPLWVVASTILLIMWALFVAASLASAGDTVVVDMRQALRELLDSSNATLAQRAVGALLNETLSWNSTLTYYAGETTLNWLQILNAFVFLWTLAFNHGLAVFVISGAVSMWYFSQNKSKQRDLKVHKMPRFYILDSLARAARYSLGTVALGSLLLAVVSSVRYFVAYIQKRLQAQRGAPEYLPRTMRTLVDCVVQCLLGWFQTLLEIVTRYSYIYASIKGESFAQSGRLVFGLLLKHTRLMASVSVLCTTLITLCKLSICVASCLVYYSIITNVAEFRAGGESAISSPVISLIACFLLAYVISTAFFSVFDVAIDTVLLCYVTDMDENVLRHMGDPKFNVPAHVKKGNFDFLQTI